MTILEIIKMILLGPLELLFEFLFQWTNQRINHPGISIIFLSLFVNLLVLPLYKRADEIQEEARNVEAKLKDGVAHIKKYFSGDERMMVLQTYYRQNNYKPTDGLKSSVSLLLQIPFFITAFQFLSNVNALNGAQLGPIADLSKPDGLLVIGGAAINILPFIMTLVNIASGILYSKGFPLKTKIQLYGMALFFLVFLYHSPSGLVFYWTLNNVFSLMKTIFYKWKNSSKESERVASCIGRFDTIKLKGRILRAIQEVDAKPNGKLFFLNSTFLTVLVGVLIPATYIAASPQEYVDITYIYNPLWYIVSSACMAIGTFMVWMRVFYGLANKKWKILFDKLSWVLCGVMVVNYMFFGTKLGVLSSSLQYENGLKFARTEKLINLLILAVLACMMYVIVVKWKRVAMTVLLTAILAFGFMAGSHIVTINQSLKRIQTEAVEEMPEFNLSKTGQNVVVFMLDRAMGEYVPYIMNENSKVREQFAGFTYYSNTISFGAYTNFGTPALLGGYEYTPVEMNKRSDMLLKDKQNEANLVLPVLFVNNGYDVTVCDPIYTNYEWIPDLSVYNDYEGIDAYIAKGRFGQEEQKAYAIVKNHRNFFCFSLMKTMPLLIQGTLYNQGAYNQATKGKAVQYAAHVTEGNAKATGISKEFMDSYSTMCNLTNITKITKDDTNTYLFMSNKMTHDPILLQEPDYTPQWTVDNTAIYQSEQERFTVDGKTMHMDTATKVMHYQANMAAFIQLGKWFDYMRENDVYDNTKIILVSDHGRSLKHLDELIYEDSDWAYKNIEFYYPLLMVKDFNSQEFTVSNEFMTNADVATIATKDVIENPVNPFTGKEINNKEKTAHDQFVIVSADWNTSKNNGNQFLPAKWASVKEDLWNLDNWKFYEEDAILQQHAFPNE